MAQRDKRSVSLPPELAAAVDEAARDEGTTFSTWLPDAAGNRLRMRAGRKAIDEWQAEHGAFTDDERAEARDRIDRLLGTRRASGRSA